MPGEIRLAMAAIKIKMAMMKAKREEKRKDKEEKRKVKEEKRKEKEEKENKLKNEFSKDSKIKSAVERCKGGVQQATTATKVKAYEWTNAFIVRFPIFLTIFLILGFYWNLIFDTISDGIVMLFTILSDNTPWFNAPISTYGWFSAMVALVIISDIVISSIPSRESKWKSGWYNKTAALTFGILIIIIVWGGISPDESLAQTSIIVADEVKENTMSGWESFWCNFDTACFLSKQNQDEVEVVDTQKFTIEMDGQKYRPYSFDEARAENIDLKYKIETGESPIYLTHVICRLNDDKGEVLSNFTLYNREILNKVERAESDIYCNLDNISIDKVKSSKLKLRVQLYYRAFTTLTQQVPFLKVDSKEEANELDYENLEKGIKTSTNELISLDPQSSASNFEFPILFGDGAYIKDEYKFNFILKLDNRYSSSGELLKSQINNISIPSIFTYSSEEYKMPYQLLTIDGKSNLRFKLKLASSDFEDDRFKQNIIFFTESTIMKKDTIYIEISDYEEQKERAKKIEDEINEAPQNSDEEQIIVADSTEVEFELIEDS